MPLSAPFFRDKSGSLLFPAFLRIWGLMYPKVFESQTSEKGAPSTPWLHDPISPDTALSGQGPAAMAWCKTSDLDMSCKAQKWRFLLFLLPDVLQMRLMHHLVFSCKGHLVFVPQCQPKNDRVRALKENFQPYRPGVKTPKFQGLHPSAQAHKHVGAQSCWRHQGKVGAPGAMRPKLVFNASLPRDDRRREPNLFVFFFFS